MHSKIFAEREGSELNSCFKLRFALQSSELHTRSILLIFYSRYQEVDELFQRVIRDIKSPFLDMAMRSLLALSLGVCVPSLAMAASLASLIKASPSDKFDRVPITAPFSKPVTAHSTLVQRSNQLYKQQRRLWKDLMWPASLVESWRRMFMNQHLSSLDCGVSRPR